MKKVPRLPVNVKMILAFVLAAFLLPGCEKKKQAPPERGMTVSAVKAERQDVPLVIVGVGQVMARHTVSVQAQVTGILADMPFKDGALVQEGQLLAVIDPAPFKAALDQAKGNLSRDQATAAQAGRDYARYKGLLDQGVVSRDDYEQRRTQLETANNQVKADQAAVETARINLNYCTIRAPIAGVAGYQMVKPGNTVNAYQTTLVSINEVQPILARFNVGESALADIRKYWKSEPLPVTARTSKASDAVKEQGHLNAIDNAVDPQTGTITLQAEFENKGYALWPGQFVTVDVELTVEKDLLVIPEEALLKRQDGNFVFVVDKDSRAELRPVKSGRTAGGKVVILEGVAPGEAVITQGLVMVTPGGKVSVKTEASGAPS